ncbi:type IX secretion system sortase PorU [Mongoliibacter ruber]|uniref:Peptidase C25-like protein n=1 Tax=Mongoliibacter ruber TaxID=1750599 RepID=A0A2T0WMH2_9BACT|nr:type IX secretion system sortase PorU [Mongoliibacter ruber]PRY87897.1 peptidase C25-like protein [Mongoliibacter ruber]
MLNYHPQYWIYYLSPFLFCTLAFPLVAQQSHSFYKFPITQEGVYQLTKEDLSSIGFGDLDEISIYGQHGMLPQKLDSGIFSLHEIPIYMEGNSAYFYTSGPHITEFNEDTFEYTHHHYTDTLYYLIGPKKEGLRIVESHTQEEGKVSVSLFRVFVKKWESNNVINSGRQWYSNPISNGGKIDMQVDIPPGNTGNGQFLAKVMAQSLSPSTFNFSTSNQSLGTVDLNSIPNSTYGIKGREQDFISSIANPGGRVDISATFSSGDANGVGFLDYSLLAIPYPASALPDGIYINTQEKSLFQAIAGKSNWKIEKSGAAGLISNQSYIQKGDKVIVFDKSSAPRAANFQAANLKARTETNNSSLIIITASQLQNQANRLESHKQNSGISTNVFTPEEIYDAFGYGNRDVTAIRDFLAYHFQKSGGLKNVLFLGKGTFDYKSKLGGRPNLVPTYTSRNSLNPLTTYSSDDFFGFLELGKGAWEENSEGDELLDIGVGRIPAITTLEAQTAVDKIIAYETPGNHPGTWKRNLAFFADDGDNNIHLNDSESHAAHISNNYPEFEIRKLYLDRYEQVISGGIQTSPEARQALKENLEEGLLILNYVGHGNETTLTAERVFTVSDLADFPDNPYLPLFVTATCEFGRQDSPFIRSGAEELLFAQRKGAIGLLTTGRPVFSSVNFRLNRAFVEQVFVRENGEIRDLGRIFMHTKNNSLNGPFNRNFSLIGDPSLRLAVPDLETSIDKIHTIESKIDVDTLRAQMSVQIKGEIKDPISGSTLSSMNGEFDISVYDKALTLKTLGDESSPVEFKEQTALVFQGKGEVKNGEFLSEIFIPTQIDYSLGMGTIRMFSTLQDGKEEAIGALNVPIGGSLDSLSTDTEGPKIKIFFGENFKENPGIIESSQIPVKFRLSDESGINISSVGIGQDITLTINDENTTFLNRDYKALNGSFKEGEILTELENLVEGENKISFKVWDNVGNSSTLETILEVRGISTVQILENVAYPNPANRKSSFRVRHNRPGENLQLSLEVYSVLGSEIYSIQKRYVEASPVLDDLEWIFFHDKINYPIKGTYIYRLSLDSEKDGTSDRKSGKIIIQ